MRARWAAAGVTLIGIALPGGSSAADGDKPDGRELFFREWTPNDPRGRGGDGLGPVYNERSCFACHAQGAPGGGGSNEHNVDLVSILRLVQVPADRPRKDGEERIVPRPLDESLAQRTAKAEARQQVREMERELHELIPGLNGSTVVVHKFGVDPDFEPWRAGILGLQNPRRRRDQSQRAASNGQNPTFRLLKAGRSTPALFGVGKIDGISDQVLQSAAARVSADFPEITGRLARTSEGAIGRFGWKGQTATLGEFVMAACSNELGLEVPGHPQASDPRTTESRVRKLDLSQEDCDALIAFVAALPEPTEQKASLPWEETTIEVGRSAFRAVGCAACHTPDIGSVQGIYSDLLLHDLGDGLQSGGNGYSEGSTPTPIDPGPGLAATEKEWRTPPLWGLSDSAPFLHDGRAATLDAAVQGHGGEATQTAQRYMQLDAPKKQAIRAFLGTLQAPKFE